MKEENVSMNAKNSELETENHALERALRELHEQSKLFTVLIPFIDHRGSLLQNTVWKSVHYCGVEN